MNAFYWPWALLKGPKRNFVVALLVGVETWVKNGKNGTKNVREQNGTNDMFAMKISSNWN